jgi:hypothetical protein
MDGGPPVAPPADGERRQALGRERNVLRIESIIARRGAEGKPHTVEP